MNTKGIVFTLNTLFFGGFCEVGLFCGQATERLTLLAQMLGKSAHFKINLCFYACSTALQKNTCV